MPFVEIERPIITESSAPPRAWWERIFLKDESRWGVVSCLLSFIAHVGLLIAFALVLHWTIPPPVKTELQVVYDSLQELADDIVPSSPAVDASLTASDASESNSFELIFNDAPDLSLPTPTGQTVTVAPKESPAELQPREAGDPDSEVSTELSRGGGYEGRSLEMRRQLTIREGGTAASEDAVERGLAWLAAHQRRDGGWRFDHRDSCNGRCANPGSIGTSTGATAIALLPFLGAGYLPEKGRYGDVVHNGLYYLRGRLTQTRHGGDLQEGTMYAQGLATLALCEAYAMSGDETLKPIAQSAVDFICHAQHPKGGWRYYPGQPGDTTVFGWQFMALKSAQMGGLHVPSPVIERAKSYLDSVQQSKGAFYGYMKPDRDPSPTAIGLLSRMYCGWTQNDLRLTAGVDFLAKTGPSPTDMYFNYYATQVLHHHGGTKWKKWNEKLREHLIATQARTDHEAGSWYFVDQHGTSGGRLYTTAISVMILEVYYRHMPLYDENSLKGF